MSTHEWSALCARISHILPAPLWVGALGALMLTAGAIFLFWPKQEIDSAQVEKPSSGIVLSDEQMRSAGVGVERLRATSLPRLFRAPGEIKANDYTAGIVSARVTATVVSRQAKLGDHVAKGQSLLTLYSQDVASAQSDFLLAQRNLGRMTRLKDMVARQLVDEAVVKEQEARGRLQSLGLTTAEIARLGARGPSAQLGQFTLTASQAGAIIEDNFRVGDVVDAGKTLFQIANLSGVWVEASVSPSAVSQIASNEATVLAGERAYGAIVLQKKDTVDEATRTVGIRLQVNNPDGALRPGEFVDVELHGDGKPVLNLPTAAVLREPNGRWVVFAENADRSFRALPVTPLYASRERTAISGVKPGTRVVVRGAFFVMSEGSKAAFGEDE